jgi:hypothetical protein
MPFNINSFKTNIRDYGYLDNNSFAVLVQTPQKLASQFGGGLSTTKIAENMSFRIDQVRAPGISLMTTDVNRYGIGPTQKQVFNAQFQEIFFSVLCDHYCEIWKYWYEWTRLCFEYNGVANGQGPTYTANYKEDYSSSVIIQMYDHFGALVQSINLFEAFPTSLREVPMAYGDSNLMKLNLSMIYTEYTLEHVPRSPNQQAQTGGVNNKLQVDRIQIQ